jgi:hypothetical protein
MITSSGFCCYLHPNDATSYRQPLKVWCDAEKEIVADSFRPQPGMLEAAQRPPPSPEDRYVL